MKFPLHIPQPSFATMVKTRLAVIVLCLIAVAASRLYFSGMDDGIAAIDQESFDSYTHFAQSMKAEKQTTKVRVAKVARANAGSVWAALDRH